MLTPSGKRFAWVLTEMEDADGQPLTVAPHAQMVFTAKGDPRMEAWALVRRLKPVEKKL